MKIAVKTITVAAIAALMLTGCAEKKEQALGVGESVAAENASTAVSSAVESKVGENASATSVESKTEESTVTSSATTSSSVSSSTTSATSTTTSSSTTSKPASTTTTSSAASSKPSSTSTTSSTTTTTSSGSSTKPVEEPTPAPAHDCNRDGHIWGDSYTKVETESTEIVEHHEVEGNGFDHSLAYKYFGTTTVDWSSVFGPGHGWGEATTAVKTTATKTTTKYFHTCKECGKSEMYDSTEVVDPGTKWERVKPSSTSCNTIWYDLNNVPQSVRDWVAEDDAAKDDFLQGLLGSGNY